MRQRLGAGHRRPAIVVAAGVLTVLPSGTASAGRPNPATVSLPNAVSASVSVNAGSHLATVPTTGIGTNGSVYDADLIDAAVPGLLNNAGVKLVRFPGGSTS